jgi:hypothetical protein
VHTAWYGGFPDCNGGYLVETSPPVSTVIHVTKPWNTQGEGRKKLNMRDEMGDHSPKEQSKFEWRPEDIIILSPEESAAATEEFEECQAELAQKTPSEEGQA